MSANVPQKLRKMNHSLVLNLIREHMPVSRAQIARLAGITKATASDVIADLLNEGLIYEDGAASDGGVGRKGIMLNFDPNHALGIGIDLGGTGIVYSVFNLGGDQLYQHAEPTFVTDDRQRFLELFIQSIRKVMQQSRQPLTKFKVISVATPGIVNYRQGIVVEGSPNLPQWENLPLATILSEALSMPVVVENDIRAALIGEIWRGSCRDAHSAAMIGVGTGLGAALLVDGKVIRGANNAAGEIGYQLFSRDHLYRNWHNKGCFETYCSGSGLALRQFTITQQQSHAKAIFAQAAAGDVLAQSLVTDLIDCLSIGILNLIALINPQRVVLIGGVVPSLAPFLPQIQANIDRQTFSTTRTPVQISSLRDSAPLYGAAALGLHRLYPSIEFPSNVQLD